MVSARPVGIVLSAALVAACGLGIGDPVTDKAPSGGGGQVATGGSWAAGGGPGDGSAGGAADGAMSGGAGGTGGASSPLPGCSDGTREGYHDAVAEPDIAACAGGFQVPGVLGPAANSPACNRVSGNSSVNPAGTGCSVADLCASGFHVCADAADVTARAKSKVCPSDVGTDPSFFATSQRMTADPVCTSDTSQQNNLAGCTNSLVWTQPAGGKGCDPLNGILKVSGCDVAPSWECAGTGNDEGAVVTKTDSTAGGVLCCRD